MKKRSLATIFVLATVAASGAFAKGGFQDPHAQQAQHAQYHHKGEFKHGGFINGNQTVSKAADANTWKDDQYIILQGTSSNKWAKMTLSSKMPVAKSKWKSTVKHGAVRIFPQVMK